MVESLVYRNLSLARRPWAALTLAQQFLFAGGAVLVAGMLVIGVWVTGQIEDGVTRNTAAATALYVDSVIAPLLPDIQGQRLSEGARRALDETLSRGALGSRLLSFKIWKDGGLVAYSSRPELIGRRFEPTANLERALNGHVSAEFDALDDDEDALERAEGVPLLEVYSPIREPWSGKVVAVAEFYEIADELKANLASTRLKSWLVVALVTSGMLALLFRIVSRGSRVITAQQAALENRIADLSQLLQQNDELRLRVQRASARSVALNERFLKRISADLHDGPAQLMALAALRLGNPQAGDSEETRAGETAMIRQHLEDAMREIRDICRGLTLPQIERLTLPELLRAAVIAHQQRTGTAVVLQTSEDAPSLTQPEKICIFRFIQEGLNNAFRHGGGADQRVTGSAAGGSLTVTLADSGPGFDSDRVSGDGLGLAGLRERVESLGGTFGIETSSAGTQLSMVLKLAERDIR